MMFMIKRGDQEFGPYGGDDIRQYLASGNIVETDLVRAEGTDRWLSVKDIVGKKPSQPEASTPAPTPTPAYTPAPEPTPTPAPMADPMFDSAPAPQPQGYDQPQGYGQPQGFDSMGASGFGQVPSAPTPSWDPGPAPQQWNNATVGAEGTLRNGAPLPPDMNWVMVFVIAMVTCGFFGFYWLFNQAGWVAHIDPQSKAKKNIMLCILGFVGMLVLVFGSMGLVAISDSLSFIAMIVGFLYPLVAIGAWVVLILTVFGMKRSIEGYFQATENLPITLNPILVFFFAPYYFQYTFNRINTWKKTGQLPN